MGRWFFLLLWLSCSVFSQQNDSISKPFGVVSAERMKVVYRGLVNPISIAVPDCKSYTASGVGLTEISQGRYELSPGSGEVAVITLRIVRNDGSIVTEDHTFKIKSMEMPETLINGLGGLVTLSEQEFQQATVSVVCAPLKFKITGFDVEVEAQPTIHVEGNSLKGKDIPGIFPGCSIVISKVGVQVMSNDRLECVRINPIFIRIYDEDLYKKDKSYRKQYEKRMRQDFKNETRYRKQLLDSIPKLSRFERDSTRAVKRTFKKAKVKK